MAVGNAALSVTEVNEYLKMLLDGDRILSDVCVCGEISNFKLYASGHAYFSLKDETGLLRAVLFRSYASRLPFLPQDGMHVIVHGRISVYGTNGQYQLYADSLQPDGAGTLAMRFEQLRRKLAAEGLFDEERKRPLPRMPMRIGVITSPSGAAIHDIINILKRRFPVAKVILYPAQVQGAEAPEQLIAGLACFAAARSVDVIILGRGGGSAEDLWAFNDEELARAVAASPIPVISAVGHESDFTICDFVADCRAPTPSAAAELAVPDRTELLTALSGAAARMQGLLLRRIGQEKRMLQQIASAGVFLHPEQLTDVCRMRLMNTEEALERAVTKLLSEKRRLAESAAGKLEALSPLAVLARGYAAVSKDGKNVFRAEALAPGDLFRVRFADGAVTASVAEREEKE